jgi:NADPH-dependent curcumin reductase CurA
MAEWIKTGQIKYRETVVEEFENAPAAFIGMLKGANIGKQLIQVSEI